MLSPAGGLRTDCINVGADYSASMRHVFLGIVIVTVLLFVGIGYSAYRYVMPYKYEETTVFIPPHTGVRDVLKVLHDSGLTPPPMVISLPLLVSGDGFKMKAGEYYFAPGMSPKQIVAKLVKGDIVVHKFTMPEGWTVYQLKLLLNVQPLLTGELPADIPEGSVFPDTVHFTRGESRAAVLAKMQKAARETLQAAWEKRSPNTPVKTPEEALILASVVEKETGIAEERRLVAGVFANRMRLGMPLQSDPTVVYGMMAEKGGAPVTRDLTTNDLRRDTPYNTYTRNGLPPGPICNPGKAAIEAVLNPEQTDALYFVATGNGGHNFSVTLKEHEGHVARYRAILRAKKQ